MDVGRGDDPHGRNERAVYGVESPSELKMGGGQRHITWRLVEQSQALEGFVDSGQLPTITIIASPVHLN